MKKIKAGIIGGAGYTGGELLRLLLMHPYVEVDFVQSNSNAGKNIYDVHTDLLGETSLCFSENHNHNVDVVFLCGGHGSANQFIDNNNLPGHVVVIDLSQDFRHNNSNKVKGRTFVYGLPELNRQKIREAKSIANPGCFATCIELSLLPLANTGVLNSAVHINATTGSTGAGQGLSATSHFSWRSGNLSVYKAFGHQHEKEIRECICSLQPGFDNEIMFIPQRGNFTRGIFSAIYLKYDGAGDKLNQMFEEYYKEHPFVTISKATIDLKQVVNTNRCFIHLEAHEGYVLITAALDNLLKGASGQAVQNMNLIFGFEERAGLQLKPSVF